jgi:hypothetical protein
MTAIGKSSVSLRVAGPHVDDQRIAAALGAPLTRLRGRRELEVWSYAIDDDSPLPAQIRKLLAGLSDDPAVWDALNRDYEVDLFCGLFMSSINEGVSMDPDLLEMLASRHLELGLDIYYTGGTR